MFDFDTMGCPQQKSAGCHFGAPGQKQNGRQIFQGQRCHVGQRTSDSRLQIDTRHYLIPCY